MATVADTKTCTTCFHERSISEFRRRWKDNEERHTVCRECYNAEQRERQRARRGRRVCTYVKEMVAAKRDANKVVALTSRLFSDLNGLEAVVSSIKGALENAQAAGRHATVFRIYKMLMDMLIVSDQLRREQLSSLSDQELEELRRREIRDEISENPALAIVAAHELQWTIIPPENEDVHT